jgi:hypothetical protein
LLIVEKGPRYIVLFGSAALMVGITITGTAHSFGQAVAGMAIAGLGGGICDVNAISGSVLSRPSLIVQTCIVFHANKAMQNFRACPCPSSRTLHWHDHSFDGLLPCLPLLYPRAVPKCNVAMGMLDHRVRAFTTQFITAPSN